MLDIGLLAWLPADISAHGAPIDRLINIIHWFMGVLFVGWGVFFAYCLFRFRARPGHAAHYEQIKAAPSKYAEIAVVIIEAVLLIGFSMPVWAQVKNEKPGPEVNPFEVRVVAQQFTWNIHYPGPDGKFGATRPDLVDEATNPIGRDLSDPAGADDVVSINNLYIPKDRPIICQLSSKDVIHSFWINVLRIKQDIVPGMVIPIWFTAKETGEYDISCAQLCGLGHYRMRGAAKILEPAEFEAWYTSANEVEEFEEE